MDKPQRPLSPHLQVYKPQLTSVLSILHRATGIVLSVSLVLLTYWLFALADGESTYTAIQSFLNSRLGTLVLFMLSWTLFYHLFNGVRHLLWDAGIGLELNTSYWTGYIVVAASLIITILLWWLK